MNPLFMTGFIFYRIYYSVGVEVEEIDLSGITCKIKGVPSFNNTGNKLKTIKMSITI